MSKYVFSDAERYADYTVHGEKCYMCGKPIDLLSAEIDHIIPEYLLDDLALLARILADFGLPADFNLNSYANWKPACGPCNNKKRAMVFEPSPLIQRELQSAAEKAPKAAALEKERISRRAVSRAWNTIARAHGAGDVPEELVKAILEFADFHRTRRERELLREPIRLAPLIEVLSVGEGLRIVRGPYGIGGGPAASNVPSEMRCGSCGGQYFNGARCVMCGEMSDD